MASGVHICRTWLWDTVMFTGPDTVWSPCPWDSIQLAELTGHRKTYQEIGQKEKERCLKAIKSSITSKRLPWQQSRKHISGSETRAREHDWSRKQRVKLPVLVRLVGSWAKYDYWGTITHWHDFYFLCLERGAHRPFNCLDLVASKKLPYLPWSLPSPELLPLYWITNTPLTFTGQGQEGKVVVVHGSGTCLLSYFEIKWKLSTSVSGPQ